MEQGGLDLSKEVLWISVCQRAAKLPAGKVGGSNKISAMRPGEGESVSNPADLSSKKRFWVPASVNPAISNDKVNRLFNSYLKLFLS